MDQLNQYKDLKARSFPFEETLEFLNQLSNGDPRIHFEIYCLDNQNLTERKKFDFGFKYYDHDEEGAEYLRSQLCQEETRAINAAYLLSSCVNRYINIKYQYKCHDELRYELLHALKKLSFSENVAIRRKSLICMGWVGCL